MLLRLRLLTRFWFTRWDHLYMKASYQEAEIYCIKPFAIMKSPTRSIIHPDKLVLDTNFREGCERIIQIQI